MIAVLRACKSTVVTIAMLEALYFSRSRSVDTYEQRALLLRCREEALKLAERNTDAESQQRCEKMLELFDDQLHSNAMNIVKTSPPTKRAFEFLNNHLKELDVEISLARKFESKRLPRLISWYNELVISAMSIT